MMREDRIIFDQVRMTVLGSIEIFADQVKELLVRHVTEIIQKNASDTGRLAGSISGKIDIKAAQIVIEVLSNMSYDVYVHEGTRPHYPDLQAILAWVKRKKLAGVYSVKTRERASVSRKLNKKYGAGYNQYVEDLIVARKIAWKIYRKGTKGIKFFELALKAAMPEVEQKIAQFKVS